MREFLKEVAELISHLKTVSILNEEHDDITLGIEKDTGKYCFLVSVHGSIAVAFCSELFKTLRNDCFDISVIVQGTDYLLVKFLQK